MTDDRYREFHLEGKQLGFLVISAIVVVVVVFLCGVMVGRGVRVPRAEPLVADVGDAPGDPTGDLVRAPDGTLADPPDLSTLSYPDLLTGSPSFELTLPESEPLPAEVEAGVPVPETPGGAVRPAPLAPAVAFKEPPGDGYAVQVASLARRGDAEVEAGRLWSKGYPSFVEPAPDGLFRVRVGKYRDRQEAESVARRLEKEEKFNKPWVDR